jgi:methyl-accepting chemotaxis protein
VQRVTDIIGEITAASSEQSDGIGQVNGRSRSSTVDAAERVAGGAERGPRRHR